MNEFDMRSIPTLLGDALSQSAKLLQNEIELAKAEMGEKVEQIGKGVGLLAAGAALLIPALVMALLALSTALIAGGWSQPVSYLISALAAALLAAVLFATGVKWLDARNLAPRETIQQLEKDKEAVKRIAR